MQLDGTLVAAKLGPGEQRQTQIDGGRVEGIDGLRQLHSERLVAVEIAGAADQHLGKVAVNAPVAHLVGVGQRVARNLPPETHMRQASMSRKLSR